MKQKIVVAIPHSHTWFWVQTCLASLMKNPPRAEGFDVEVVVVDNSPWSPAIRGVGALCRTPFAIGDAPLSVLDNYKSNRFHASALDCVVEMFEFDYLMALETDVVALRPTWLQWFVDQMKDDHYAVGMWHHEQFVNPSCTLYRGSVLRQMMVWCQNNKSDVLNWGPWFERTQPIAARQPERDYRGWYDDNVSWIAGPFAEKRGWPAGTTLKEPPSGQEKGPGWYEPGQQLHHWAVEAGWGYRVCPTTTTTVDGVPVQSMYGDAIMDPGRQLGPDEMTAVCPGYGPIQTAHLWGGTRALDIIKHEVTCQFVKSNTPKWLAREARFWKATVPLDVQERTLELIRQHGWHITGQGTDHVSARDKEAAAYVRECYRAGGVEW